MPVLEIPGGICAAKGFLASGIHCGIRHNTSKQDLAIIVSEVDCTAAAVYTQNKVKGAPLIVTKNNIQNGVARGIICNSGNANTCAPGGLKTAKACCEIAAKATGLNPENFVIASTGVIGQELPLAPFVEGIPKAVAALSKDGGQDAAAAIMTTDTKMKEYAIEFKLDGAPCRIGIIGKGSGMVQPNMATNLFFITTDAAITSPLLQDALRTVTQVTFNQVSIDGDTSTNDMAVVLANGLANNPMIADKTSAYLDFCTHLQAVCTWMCRAIAADGEGATKLLECHVTGAPTTEMARAIAKSVIASNLLKAAMFGADANWGRILCAIGYTPGDFSVEQVSVTLKSKAGSVLVCRQSAHSPYSEEDASRILAEDKIWIEVDLENGPAEGVAWGCDLTYDYVKINGDYRS